MFVELKTPPNPLQHSTVSVFFAEGCTDVGRVRESNQDNYLVSTQMGLFVVADGMGGRAGGEVASQLAVETIGNEVERHLDRLLESEERSVLNFFSSAINKASLRIYERSLELPQFRGMGTTATLVWIPPQEHQVGSDLTDRSQRTATIAHVGDSRCYLCRSGLLFQLTDDHSLVNEQIKAGVLDHRDPLISQIRNVITRCVGYQEDEEVDTTCLTLCSGDRLLLCSDGLSTKVTDEEIRAALMQEHAEGVAAELTALANERGGDDNITVIVVAL
jgi:protein phosphatase